MARLTASSGRRSSDARRRPYPALSSLNTTRPFFALFLVATGCFLLFLRTGSTSYARADLLTSTPDHPNFDFDSPGAVHLAAFEEEEEMREEEVVDVHVNEEETGGDEGEGESLDGDSEGVVDSDEELEEDVLEDDIEQYPLQLHPSLRHSSAPESTLARPFLPFTCEPCSTLSSSHPAPPTCAKYRHAQSAPPSSPFHPSILDRSVLFPGTGDEVRRVLKRATKSSLYGARRAREGAETSTTKFQDEDPFRILVLGGSVSNCRGVDEKTSCWHAHALRWFQQTMPMEGDRELVPFAPTLYPRDGPSRPQRLDDRSTKTILAKRAVEVVELPIPVPDYPSKRQPARKKLKKKSKKKQKKVKSSRRVGQPLTRLINASKSATGSAFFAYCFDEEMTVRRKNIEWGKGPDLVVLEFGVNDVWPSGDVATQDFEKLLRTLRAMPSSPAIIILEAASLLLAQTTSFTSNAEYLHLPAAQFYDVPVLSAKHSLFGPTPGILPQSGLKIEDLFLPDLHHPNERGHQLLGDILISYLERQACEVQAEILAEASERIRLTKASSLLVDPEVDIGRRKEEKVLPPPHRSLFDPFGSKLGSYDLPPPKCLQVGNAKSTLVPVSNVGWTKFAWARDKQYLVASKPGSTVTFNVVVGAGGTVLVDWLHSRFYDLGNVLVYLDGQKSEGATLAGWWDLGWSIGVPTKVFDGVAAGPHTVTFELLSTTLSSHPSHKTTFRLIGLITT